MADGKRGRDGSDFRAHFLRNAPAGGPVEAGCHAEPAASCRNGQCRLGIIESEADRYCEASPCFGGGPNEQGRPVLGKPCWQASSFQGQCGFVEQKPFYAQGATNFIPSLVKSPSGQKVVIAWVVASDKSVVARGMCKDMTSDLRPELDKIKPPVTILYPWDASMGIARTACVRLYRGSYTALLNKKFIRIDGSFHFIMFDHLVHIPSSVMSCK